MKKRFTYIIIFMCVIMVTACGKENKLIGKWNGDTTDGINTTYIFKNDGKVEYFNEYGYDTNGTYKIEENVITIKLDSWSEQKKYKYEIKDNKLSLTAEDKYSPNYSGMIKVKK